MWNQESVLKTKILVQAKCFVLNTVICISQDIIWASLADDGIAKRQTMQNTVNKLEKMNKITLFAARSLSCLVLNHTSYFLKYQTEHQSMDINFEQKSSRHWLWVRDQAELQTTPPSEKNEGSATRSWFCSVCTSLSRGLIQIIGSFRIIWKYSVSYDR